MAYRGFCIHDVAEEEGDTLDDVYWSQIIYVDFDTEDEAYEFGWLAGNSASFDNLIHRLGNKACEREEK